jgi:outer membrane lipoprotein SlyB
MTVLTDPQAPAAASRRNTQLALVGAALGLFALGALATALVLKGPAHPETTVAAAVDAPAPALQEAPVAAAPPAARVAVQPAKKHAGSAAPAVPEHATTALATPPVATQPTATQPTATTAQPECATCGIVESVTPIQQKGQASGIGAVAGGVLGGVLGHQVGAGNGRKAMTLLGAIGGGLAGNEVEKHQRSTTVYQLKIRMADGSTHSLTQAQALAVGQRVHFDGQHVTPMAADAAPADARLLETSSRSS